MNTQVNYVGITRRIIASVIDYVIMSGIFPILYFSLAGILVMVFKSNELGNSDISLVFDFLRSNRLLVILIVSIFFMILEIIMVTRFSGTPGQLLCGIHINDANTFKNITITQAIIRCVSREVVTGIVYFPTRYTSIWFAALTIVIILAILDK
ncbi:RDD family protein [Wolbachia endosymbiont (group A) of Andrena hattorfiana]|uniref:RDD family protein n=1 Tax=Wolbachia endosymbiont (group A) of Andrena hattorfiana TaxID=2953977 RepID=UPI0021F8B7BD|nr:RDD family protein [Wolbachia endosymbiont (group A) of Andrena hattorfiana]